MTFLAPLHHLTQHYQQRCPRKREKSVEGVKILRDLLQLTSLELMLVAFSSLSWRLEKNTGNDSGQNSQASKMISETQLQKNRFILPNRWSALANQSAVSLLIWPPVGQSFVHIAPKYTSPLKLDFLLSCFLINGSTTKNNRLHASLRICFS